MMMMMLTQTPTSYPDVVDICSAVLCSYLVLLLANISKLAATHLHCKDGSFAVTIKMHSITNMHKLQQT